MPRWKDRPECGLQCPASADRRESLLHFPALYFCDPVALQTRERQFAMVTSAQRFFDASLARRNNPANSKHDFSWALATGILYSIGSAPRP